MFESFSVNFLSIVAPKIPQRGGYVLTGNKILACSTGGGGRFEFESLKQYFRHFEDIQCV